MMAAMLKGIQVPQPISSYDAIKMFTLLWQITLQPLIQRPWNFIGKHNMTFYVSYYNLGPIGLNLHNYDFDDVICKPPIDDDAENNGLEVSGGA